MIGRYEITAVRDECGEILHWQLAMIYFGNRVTSRFCSRNQAEKYIAGLRELRNWMDG